MNRFLKPCPFCGSTNVYITYEWGRNNDTSVIFCDECKVSVKLEENDGEGCNDKTERKAAEAWNRRADKTWLVTTLDKRNEGLEKQVYEFAKQILELKEENARLKTELKEANCKPKTEMVYKQDVIDAVRGRFSTPVDNLIVEVVDGLPSAQPEKVCIAEINVDKEFMLKAVERAKLDILEANQSKPKKGKWIIRNNPETGWYCVTCSECGEDQTSCAPIIGFFPNAKVTWNHCPNCGAEMEDE